MDLPYTRSMVRAALDGDLEGVQTKKHPIFGLEMPTSCPGVPDEVLDPKATWSDPQAYDHRAAELAQSFTDNFAQYKGSVEKGVMQAGPKTTS
jgi:phosphoenolpyruvate carboxykinase (ATP)